nr:MAG TPA: Mitochondrial FAD-linked sulfhydryl oxidase ERV1-linked sulfhydryl oxidase, Mia40, oxidation [Bacteriophage sp.]
MLLALHLTGRPCRICASGSGNFRVLQLVLLHVLHFATMRCLYVR